MATVTRTFLLFLVVFGYAAAAAAATGTIVVERPWARASAAPTGAVFMSIRNTGEADRLVAVSSPVAAEVQVHVSEMDGQVMRMRRVDGLDLPAHGTTVLQPGGYHVMLIGLKEPLKAGTTVPLTLEFAKAGRVTVTAPVESVGAMHGGDH